jgi:predicted  nucleic acid-binding Zn-ribbon protein
MAIITKRATRVIENLAKAVVSLEDKNNQMGDTLISFLKTAEQMMSKQDKEIVELRKRLEVMRHVN